MLQRMAAARTSALLKREIPDQDGIEAEGDEDAAGNIPEDIFTP
jgi:hypothetical protein